VGLTQQRASVWPCAVEALLRLELLVLLLQGKRTKRKKQNIYLEFLLSI